MLLFKEFLRRESSIFLELDREFPELCEIPMQVFLNDKEQDYLSMYKPAFKNSSKETLRDHLYKLRKKVNRENLGKFSVKIDYYGTLEKSITIASVDFLKEDRCIDSFLMYPD